jgi:hypothetical protein
MLDGVFARGTTPTQIFPIPGELVKSDFLDLTIAYRQKGKLVLLKRKDDTYDIPEVDSEKNIIVVLSQAETLMFNPNIKIVEVQVRGATVGHDVIPMGEYRLRLDDAFDEGEFDLENLNG